MLRQMLGCILIGNAQRRGDATRHDAARNIEDDIIRLKTVPASRRTKIPCTPAPHVLTAPRNIVYITSIQNCSRAKVEKICCTRSSVRIADAIVTIARIRFNQGPTTSLRSLHNLSTRVFVSLFFFFICSVDDNDVTRASFSVTPRFSACIFLARALTGFPSRTVNADWLQFRRNNG